MSIIEPTARIVLKSGKDQSLRRRHPWVFSGAIKKVYGEPAEGDVVEVFDNKEEKLGMGHYQVQGSISMRMLTFGDTPLTESTFAERIDRAYKHRKEEQISSGDTNVFRLINAEGDGLPGLIVDYYAGTAVIQMHSSGMHRSVDQIAAALEGLDGLQIDAIYNKSKNTLHATPGIEPADYWIKGDRQEDVVREHGFSFKVNWVRGQKTGFFVDQRENRLLLKQYSKNRSVLNMFCFSGGFSVYAMAGGAKRVHSVDSSGHAIDLTRENMELNFPGDERHEASVTDAFTFLNDMSEQYDLIILDPPAFAKHQRVLNNALQGYKRLNQRALEKIAPGGILFTYSCSQAVSRENFKKSLFAAAANTGRDVRILHHMGQPTDHPVSIYHPEGEYLKGLVVKVED